MTETQKTERLVSEMEAKTAAHAGSRAVQLLLLSLIALTGTYSWSMLSPVQETIRAHSSLDDHHLALIQGAALGIPMAVMAVPIGLLIDRTRRVRLLLAFAALNALGALMTAFAHDFASLASARALIGIAVPAMNTTIFSLTADLFTPTSRGRARMIVDIGQYLGMAAAFAGGGYLLSLPAFAGANWNMAVLVMAAPLALSMALPLALGEPARREVGVVRPDLKSMFGELRRHRGVLAQVIAGIIVASMATLGGRVWAAPALTRALDASAPDVGAIMAFAVLVSGPAGAILGGGIADYCQTKGGPRYTLTALALLTLLCIPAGAFGLATDAAAASALIVAFLTIGSTILVIGGTLVTIVVPNEMRGFVMSLVAAGEILLGIGITPSLIASVSDYLGGASMLGEALALLTAGSCALGATIFLLGRRAFPLGSGRAPNAAPP